MLYENQNCFVYNPDRGGWVTQFNKVLAIVRCSADIQFTPENPERMKADKPAYVAIMAHRQHIQPILDNPHLFAPEFVNAARLAANDYDALKVE